MTSGSPIADGAANRRRQPFAAHDFGKACRERGMEHLLAKVNRPWTNGRLERINRMLKEVTVNRREAAKAIRSEHGRNLFARSGS